ncbi:MAG: uroporphyrinogen decarboxylase family protein [Bacillota bacterium]
MIGGNITLVGGVNNPRTLLNGRVSDVRQEVTGLLDNGIKLVAPECAVPIRTPNNNIRAITQSVREYNRKLRNYGRAKY